MERLRFRDCLRISIAIMLVTNAYLALRRALTPRKHVTIIINTPENNEVKETPNTEAK